MADQEREAAVAVAQQHAHVVAADIVGDEVGDAVAVEVGHGDGAGALPARKETAAWKLHRRVRAPEDLLDAQ